MLKPIPGFPPRAEFPTKGPVDTSPWAWEQFLRAVEYRERRMAQTRNATGSFATFLRHEIKRAEIDIGLWLGRMKEGYER